MLIMSPLMMLMMQGCINSTNVCPTYPKPSQSVLNSIRDINNTEVDSWMIEQLKLSRKLNVNKE